ncbi:hypothetical protein [Nocardia sp. NPDC057668]|uniref:hypothetical protein n=1 Tax=Nocardia sp. NPDC057668 TaxID=3346202 RepID=UPI00366BB163
MVDTTNTGREHTPPVPPQLEALAHIEFDIRGGSGVESAIGKARSEFPEFEQTMARLRFEKPVNYPLLFPAEMARATHAEVAAKVDRLRALLPNGDYDDYIAQFPPGVELDERQLLDSYLECIDFEAEYRGGPAHAGSPRDDLRVPPELIVLFGITGHPRAGYLDLGLNPRRLQGEIMDPDGECCRLDEHWIRVGLLGNDLFLVSLTSGEVMFADQYFWRYAEKDASRVVAPDLLTFFNEYLVGPRYLEFASPEELENPRGWFAFLRNNGFA